MDYSFQSGIAITSVSDLVAGASVLSEVRTGSDTDKFISIASPDVATLTPWRLRVGYTPATATINGVRAFVESQGVRDELSFSTPTMSNATIALNNVRLPATGRALWSTKPNKVRVVVEVTGSAPGGGAHTVQSELGVGDRRGSAWELTALYDADRIPQALRYPTSINHSWGTTNARVPRRQSGPGVQRPLTGTWWQYALSRHA